VTVSRKECLKDHVTEQQQLQQPLMMMTVAPQQTQESETNKTVHWVLEAILISIHAQTICVVIFAPLASLLELTLASFDGTVAIWQWLNMVHNLLLSSSSSTISAAALAVGWECTAQLEGHENDVKCISFNVTGSLLVSCGWNHGYWHLQCSCYCQG